MLSLILRFHYADYYTPAAAIDISAAAVFAAHCRLFVMRRPPFSTPLLRLRLRCFH